MSTYIVNDGVLDAHDDIVYRHETVTVPVPIPIQQAENVLVQSGSQTNTLQKTQTLGRSRPQSFAQKLRSTGKTVKGKLG